MVLHFRYNIWKGFLPAPIGSAKNYFEKLSLEDMVIIPAYFTENNNVLKWFFKKLFKCDSMTSPHTKDQPPIASWLTGSLCQCMLRGRPHPSSRHSFMMFPSYGVFRKFPQDRSTAVGLMEPITRWSGFSRFTFPVRRNRQGCVILVAPWRPGKHMTMLLWADLCSQGPMFPESYVSSVLCSQDCKFPGSYVPKVLHSQGFMFPRAYVLGSYVPRALCFQGPKFLKP